MITLEQINRYKGMCCKLASFYYGNNKRYMSKHDYDDMMQEAYLGVIEAIKSYKGKKERCSLATRVWTKVRERILKYVAFCNYAKCFRYWYRVKRTQTFNFEALEMSTDEFLKLEGFFYGTTPLDEVYSIEDKLIRAAELKAIRNQFSKVEYDSVIMPRALFLKKWKMTWKQHNNLQQRTLARVHKFLNGEPISPYKLKLEIIKI